MVALLAPVDDEAQRALADRGQLVDGRAQLRHPCAGEVDDHQDAVGVHRHERRVRPDRDGRRVDHRDIGVAREPSHRRAARREAEQRGRVGRQRAGGKQLQAAQRRRDERRVEGVLVTQERGQPSGRARVAWQAEAHVQRRTAQVRVNGEHGAFDQRQRAQCHGELGRDRGLAFSLLGAGDQKAVDEPVAGMGDRGREQPHSLLEPPVGSHLAVGGGQDAQDRQVELGLQRLGVVDAGVHSRAEQYEGDGQRGGQHERDEGVQGRSWPGRRPGHDRFVGNGHARRRRGERDRALHVVHERLGIFVRKLGGPRRVAGLGSDLDQLGLVDRLEAHPPAQVDGRHLERQALRDGGRDIRAPDQPGEREGVGLVGAHGVEAAVVGRLVHHERRRRDVDRRLGFGDHRGRRADSEHEEHEQPPAAPEHPPGRVGAPGGGHGVAVPPSARVSIRSACPPGRRTRARAAAPSSGDRRAGCPRPHRPR